MGKRTTSTTRVTRRVSTIHRSHYHLRAEVVRRSSWSMLAMAAVDPSSIEQTAIEWTMFDEVTQGEEDEEEWYKQATRT